MLNFLVLQVASSGSELKPFSLPSALGKSVESALGGLGAAVSKMNRQGVFLGE